VDNGLINGRLQVSTTHEPRDEIRKLSEEFAHNLRNGGQPRPDDFLARIDASLQDKLREELVGEEFAYRFGDATQNGKLRYRPIATLGTGAFGEGYKAVDEELDRIVAIKVLLRTDDSVKQRFLAEARRQANLPKHNHLVGVHDSGTLPKGHAFSVMEYVEGGTLRERLRADGKLDAETAARLVQQMSLAVAAVHEGTSGSRAHPTVPLVHRDLKPENILLDRLGNVCLADFGIAAAVADLHDGAAGAGGTIAYMSPEQATAFRPGMTAAPVDTRTDVWALGVILYELLAGTQPFVSNEADAQNRRDEIFDAIQQYEPPRLRDLSPDVPTELEALVAQCLKKDVAERIQTANEVADRLRRWLVSVAAIPAPLDFAARLAEARKDFSDRPWLFDEVDAWRVHENERLLLLTGELGSGKSAFLAELIHRNPEKRILAWHLCRHDWPESRNAAKFVRSLAGMLAQRVDDYRSKLADLHLREALRIENREQNPADAFEAAISTPIAACAPPADGIWFVIVDAVDEADLSGSPSIPDLVAQWDRRRLPPWLRLIVSVRRDALGPNTFAGHRHLAIDRDNADRSGDICDDIQRFIRVRLAQPNLAERLQQSRVDAQAATSTLLQKSEANYLYVAEAFVAIELDQITFAELSALPPGLTALYDAFFRRQWPNKNNFASVRPLLEVLTVAEEPLQKDLLAAATSLDNYELNARLDSLAQYLAVRRSNEIRLRHQALADWLANTGGNYRVDRKEGHKKLANACLNEYREFKQGNATLTPYTINHLPHHLIESENWKSLAELLTDLPFLEAKVEAGFVFELIRDLRRAYGALPPRNAQRSILDEITSVLSDHSAFLDAHRDHVFQCLYNATAPTWNGTTASTAQNSLKAVAEQWLRDRSTQRPWIRVLRRVEPSGAPTFRFHSAEIRAIAVLRVVYNEQNEHELIISADRAGIVKIWGSDNRQVSETRFPDYPHCGFSELSLSMVPRAAHHVTCLASSADGSHFVIGSTAQNYWLKPLPQNIDADFLTTNIPFPSNPPFPSSPKKEDLPIPVLDVVFSPDSTYLAIAAGTSSIVLTHCMEDRTTQLTSPANEARFHCICFRDDDTLLAGTSQGVVVAFSLSSDGRMTEGRNVCTFVDQMVKRLAVRDDSTVIAALQGNKTPVGDNPPHQLAAIVQSPNGQWSVERLWDLGFSYGPHQLALSHDRTTATITSIFGEVAVVDLNGAFGTKVIESVQHAPTLAVAHSRRKHAAVYLGHKDGTVTMLNPSAFRQPRSEAVWLSRLLAGGSICTLDTAGNIRIVLIDSGESFDLAAISPSSTVPIVFDSSGQVAFASSTDEVFVAQVDSKQMVRHRLGGRGIAIGGCADHPLLVVAETDRLTVLRVDESADEVVSQERQFGPNGAVVAWSADGEYLAIAWQNPLPCRWNETWSVELLQLQGKSLSNKVSDVIDLLRNYDLTRAYDDRVLELMMTVRCIAVGRGGNSIAIGMCFHVVVVDRPRDERLRDIKKYKPPCNPQRADSIVISEVLFSEDGRKLAIRLENGSAWVLSLDSERWQEIGRVAGLGNWVFDLNYVACRGETEVHTEICDLSGNFSKYLPESLELVGIGSDAHLLVAKRRRNGAPLILRIER
jgi:serine/threonine protein kinase/WD40 repeat protein